MDRPDPWNDSRSGWFLWVNANVGEAIPDTLTPASWSVARVFLDEAIAGCQVAGHRAYGRLGGRVYLNLSVLRTLAYGFGQSEQAFRATVREAFGQLPEGVAIPLLPARRAAIVRDALPVAAAVLRAAVASLGLSRQLSRVPARCLELRSSIAAADAADLVELGRTSVWPEYGHLARLVGAATRFASAAYLVLRPRAEAGAIGGLASLDLIRGRELLRRGTIDADEFRRRFGHRGPHEFELAQPRPGELVEPPPREAPLHPPVAGGSGGWPGLRVRVWSRFARDREHARSELVRHLWVLRAYLLRAGELTGLGADVFYLELDEVAAVLAGGTVPQESIAQRRRAHAAYVERGPYPAVVLGAFDPYAEPAEPARSPGPLRGFAGSGGVVEAVVRVVTRVQDAEALRPGEVLVATATNVGWTPYFPRAGAIVTDVGAPLSHAAIVARELGIPAVVGCGDATRVLRTGDRVRVDGRRGTVERLT